MADSKLKQEVRARIKNIPLWDTASDIMSQVLFPRAVNPSIGIAPHARLIFYYLYNYNKVLIQLPRYHGKSTYITFMYVMDQILKRRRRFILLISSTGNQAVKFLQRVRSYLESKKVKTYYGDLAASKSVVVDTGNQSYEYVESSGKRRSIAWNFREVLIEPWDISIMATSIKSANRGLLNVDTRPDLIILDDVEDKSNTNTPELRDRLSDTIVEEIFPAGATDCQYIVIGTICHFDSFLLKLRNASGWSFLPITRATDTIKNIREYNDLFPYNFPDKYRFDPKPEYFSKDRIGLDSKSYKAGQETPEVAIWQKMYSYEFFCDKKAEYESLGKGSSFWQEYYNIPKSRALQVFKKFSFLEDVEFAKYMGEMVLISNGYHVFDNNKKIINIRSFLGGDLAVSDRESADWRVFFTVFTDPFFNVYVLPPYYSKEPDPFKIGEYVLEMNMAYNYYAATFDSQHFQRWFKDILENICKSNPKYRRARIRKIYQKSRYERKEDVIMATLSPIINSGRMYFLGNYDNFEMLIKELMNLGYYNSDDFADALTYACSNLSYPDLVDFDNVRPTQEHIHYDQFEQIDPERIWIVA